jgi:DNA polymerase-1
VNDKKEKKALSLIKQFQTIENIYTHLDEIDSSVANILKDQKDIAFFSKSMVKLAEVDLSTISLENMKFTLNYDHYISTLGKKYSFASLEKLLLEMKKEDEKPKQLGLF